MTITDLINLYLLLADKSNKEQIDFICKYKSKEQIADMFIEIMLFAGNYLIERIYESNNT